MKLENDWFRPAVCYLVKAREIKQKEVASMFGVYAKKISDAIKRFEETGEHRDRKGRGRKCTATDEAHVKEAQTLLELNNPPNVERESLSIQPESLKKTKERKNSTGGPKEIFAVKKYRTIS